MLKLGQVLHRGFVKSYFAILHSVCFAFEGELAIAVHAIVSDFLDGGNCDWRATQLGGFTSFMFPSSPLVVASYLGEVFELFCPDGFRHYSHILSG